MEELADCQLAAVDRPEPAQLRSSEARLECVELELAVLLLSAVVESLGKQNEPAVFQRGIRFPTRGKKSMG